MNPDLHLDWCSFKAAKYAVENWHYSKRMPVFKIVKIGIWEDAIFKGCVLFSRGASPYLLKRYNLKMVEGCELTRIALASHLTPVSKIIKISIKFLKKLCPKLRLIVSFADPRQGHLGIVYQANGWIYAGITNKKKVYFDENGREFQDRLVCNKGYAYQGYKYTKVLKPSEAKKTEKVPGKYRYLFPLDKRMRKQIEPLSKPYPKRLPEMGIPDQGVQGGSTPTQALQ